MSRFVVGSGFFVLDAAASIMSILNGPGMLVVLVVSTVSSITTALMFRTVSSVLWPTYFWDESS